MFSLDGYRIVDLSPRVRARVYRVDGTVEEGTRDPYGRPWVMEEGRFAGDNSLFTLYSAPEGDSEWHQQRMTSHHGAHVQGGKGHISHWLGASPDMKGLWEMPIETFMGEASVCNLSHLAPRVLGEGETYPLGEGYSLSSKVGELRGVEIKPEHLGNVAKGDIVLMTSSHQGLEQPWLSPATVAWLIEDREIEMLGLSATGILWQYDLKVAAPDNSPVRRMLLGANVPIAHPLVDIDQLKSDRVIYVGLPLRMNKFEASFIRAVAYEAPEEA